MAELESQGRLIGTQGDYVLIVSPSHESDQTPQTHVDVNAHSLVNYREVKLIDHHLSLQEFKDKYKVDFKDLPFLTFYRAGRTSSEGSVIVKDKDAFVLMPDTRAEMQNLKIEKGGHLFIGGPPS